MLLYYVIMIVCSFPESLHKLPLAELYIDDNLISAIPPSIKRFQNLVQLRLGNNQVCCSSFSLSLLSKLRHIAPEIGLLGQLQTLDLSVNNLTTLPPQIGLLTSLQSLFLASNALTTLPDELAGCTAITRLNFYVCNSRICKLKFPCVVLFTFAYCIRAMNSVISLLRLQV